MSEDILKEEEAPPLEVIIKNHPEIKKSQYDSKDDTDYEDIAITMEEVEEFENGKSTSG